MICVGIDIAKGKSTVCFLKPGGEVLKATSNTPPKKSESLYGIFARMARRFAWYWKPQDTTTCPWEFSYLKQTFSFVW